MRKIGWLLLLFTSQAWATPSQVIIIRHGEKNPRGHHLSVKGRERAAALAPFFLGTPELLRHGLPVAIYATDATSQHPSFRTQETVQPLAHQLQLPIRHPFMSNQAKALAQEILNDAEFDGKMVLVCWGHNHIPELAKALGVTAAPPPWKGDVYDRLWIINHTLEGKVNFEDRPQRLLFGDSPE